MSSDSIFISIAAYREFDLPETLRSLFTMADDVSRLAVCICWQRDVSESLGEWAHNPQIQLIDIPYQESRGVCWARHLIQQEYRGERYFLQLDGHHRFVPGWDTQLVDMLESLRAEGCAKPILTSYLPAFDPADDPGSRTTDLWLLGVDRFDESGVLFMRPYIPIDTPERPVPTRFWSAHFSFSDGKFVTDVPIDPEGYFHGEEIGTCVRAWTSGYDFFCPHRTLLWHEYTRKGRRCHWDDHADWTSRNTSALARYAQLVGLDGAPRCDFGPYGLGDQRSLSAYERFAGISFARRSIAEPTLANQPPTCLPDGLAEGSDLEFAAEPAEGATTNLSSESVPARTPGWSAEHLEGEVVLYDANSTRACYLNETAALVWHLVDGKRTAREICDLIAEAYRDAPSVAQDVGDVFASLRSSHVIHF